MIRKSLRSSHRWNPSRPFYVPVFARKFRPDFSFSEQNTEEALRERAMKSSNTDSFSSAVQLESEIGQRRYEFCLRTMKEQRGENPELVELVIASLLRATDCDVARTLHRAQQYFDFYEEVFGELSFKQTLTNNRQMLRESFESEVVQVFENCDDKGRGAIVILMNRILPGQPEFSGMQMIRLFNYLMLRTLRNYPTTQKNGFIIIADMGGLSFENYSFAITRTNLYVLSKFLPCKIHKICLLRPLYFVKFVLPALKSFAFPGPMASRVHILTQDPRDLLRQPINLRPEILPPMYGGTNRSYDFMSRLRGWRLEEEERACSDMGGSCGGARGENCHGDGTEEGGSDRSRRGGGGSKKMNSEHKRGRKSTDSIGSDRKQNDDDDNNNNDSSRLDAKEQRGLPPRVPDTDRGDNCGFVSERFKRRDEYGNEIDMDATRSADSIGSDNNGDDVDNETTSYRSYESAKGKIPASSSMNTQ